MGPLSGLRVIEMTGLAPAPYCAMLLADLGADVLRIDRPSAPPPGREPTLELLTRNRPSVRIDLKSPEGVEALLDLIDRSDALIEGFRPGVMERMGLGPDVCAARNPKLVYGRVTGWGQDGPIAQAAGHDVNYLALSGALHYVGSAGGPPVIPLNLVGDFAGGGLFLAFGIMCAVFEANRSGTGQVVDAAMVDGAASMMTYLFGHRAMKILSDVRGESVLNGASPFYAVYETKDGEWVSVAAAEPQFYAELLARIGIDDQDELSRQLDRDRWPAMRQRIEAIFRTRTRAEWCEVLEGTDACFAPVLTMGEAAEHPQNRHRGTFMEVDGVLQPAPSPRFGRTPAAVPLSPDQAAMAADLVLQRWGLPPTDAEDLVARRVVT